MPRNKSGFVNHTPVVAVVHQTKGQGNTNSKTKQSEVKTAAKDERETAQVPGRI